MWPSREDEEYSAQKERWLKNGGASSVAHFLETRELARFCCHTPEFRAELPVWHAALREAFLKHPFAPMCDGGAAYELVMTTAHAREWNLGGTEDAIAHILGSIAELDDYGSLTDAANVLAAAYVWESKYSAALLLATNIEAHQVQLTDRIAQVIELESSTGALALRELVVHIGDNFVNRSA